MTISADLTDSSEQYVTFMSDGPTMGRRTGSPTISAPNCRLSQGMVELSLTARMASLALLDSGNRKRLLSVSKAATSLNNRPTYDECLSPLCRNSQFALKLVTKHIHLTKSFFEVVQHILRLCYANPRCYHC